MGKGQSFKLAASYLTKKQIKFWTNLVKILITQPLYISTNSLKINALKDVGNQ